MLGADEQDRFDQWRKSQSDLATFFLDSIDELKITQKSFEQALKSLGRACAGNMDGIRVVITTRPIPLDQLIESNLAIPPGRDEPATGEAFADTAMQGRQPRKGDDKAVMDWRCVGLMPLAQDEIEAFAKVQGVQDPEALLADIRKRDAAQYAHRQQDLIELCADWKDHHRFGFNGEGFEVFSFVNEADANRFMNAFSGEPFDYRDAGSGKNWMKWYKGRAANREKNRSPYDFRK